MPAVFVAGTGTDVGKTYVAAALIRAIRSSGRAVDALKPVVSGFDEAAPQGSDPAVLLEALGLPVSAAAIAHMSPWRFRAPLAPALAARLEGRRLLADEVVALCRRRIADAGGRLMVIEAAGGIMSPLDEATTMLDLARALEIPVLLVAGSYLGTISHTLTAARAIRTGGLGLAAVAVSETAQSPPLAPTLEALSARLAPIPVFPVARGAGVERALLGLIG
jgi:dethiobiotin synthetase